MISSERRLRQGKLPSLRQPKHFGWKEASRPFAAKAAKEWEKRTGEAAPDGYEYAYMFAFALALSEEDWFDWWKFYPQFPRFNAFALDHAHRTAEKLSNVQLCRLVALLNVIPLGFRFWQDPAFKVEAYLAEVKAAAQSQRPSITEKDVRNAWEQIRREQVPSPSGHP